MWNVPCQKRCNCLAAELRCGGNGNALVLSLFRPVSFMRFPQRTVIEIGAAVEGRSRARVDTDGPHALSSGFFPVLLDNDFAAVL